jgi:CO/xanthine dehydrogenase FAD-binding subunit
MRATEAEEWLAGELAATDVWYSAGEMAAEAAQPTGDVHADARFRRDAVCALVYETLYEAYEPLRYAPA